MEVGNVVSRVHLGLRVVMTVRWSLLGWSKVVRISFYQVWALGMLHVKTKVIEVGNVESRVNLGLGVVMTAF